MGSAWVEHVKSVYAKGKKKGMSYKEAMQKAKVSWAKKKGGAAAKAPAKKGKKKKAEETEEKAEVAEKPKRQKKKAGRGLEDQESGDAPQSSKKARSSRASRKTKKASVQRKDVAPKGLPGMGAPYKQ